MPGYSCGLPSACSMTAEDPETLRKRRGGGRVERPAGAGSARECRAASGGLTWMEPSSPAEPPAFSRCYTLKSLLLLPALIIRRGVRRRRSLSSRPSITLALI
ncbi:hypothetical protein OJAV_G00107380 [Oryzias javanicus]|uniref:Uncharacterized protein n=1 Tax=Oryzias javanicus TaxID=123683 RepID=A0A437CU13_ORYJA|nr:hypothetical protein OJAV_G00107380 [Oryzias javanicus]